MKPHLPSSLFCWLKQVALASVCMTMTANTAHAILMDAQFDVKTYRDFAENRGRFAAGNTNIPIWDKQGNVVGNVANTDNNPGISMISFDGISDTSGRFTLVDYQITSGCGHIPPMTEADILFNRRFGKNQEQAFRVINDTLHPNYGAGGDGIDVRVQRLARIVTTAMPYSVMTDMDMIDRLIKNELTVVRVGKGEHRISGVDYNTKYGSMWLAGGVVQINDKGSYYQKDRDYLHISNIFNNHIAMGDADKYPLPLGMQNGDSGSPAFAWNDKINQWQFIGTSTHYSVSSNYGTTHQIRGAPLWTVRQANSYNDTYNSILGGSEITFRYDVGVVSGGFRNIKVIQDGKERMSTTGATSGWSLSWKNRTTFAAPPADAAQHRNIVWGPNGGTIRLTRDGVNKYGVLDCGAGSWRFQGNYIIEGDEGYVRWDASGTTKDAFLQFTVSNAGFIVDEGCTLIMRTTGRSASLGGGYDEWRKSGSGTMRIEGSGNNGAVLDVGGDGLVILARTGGYAAENLIINGGFVRVVLEKDNQLNNFSFGFRGGYLDLNGFSLTRAGISHVDSGAKIVNFGANTTSVFTYTGSGYYQGSFLDNGSLANGLLKVVYNGTGTLGLSGVSNNMGGYEINGGIVTVSGSNTIHAGSQFWEGNGHGQNDENMSDPDDWHYAQIHTSDIVLNNNSTFIVGHHSRVNGDVTVNNGTFQITEGVYKSQAEAIDGYQKGAIDPSLYGHTGTVTLKGSNAHFVANISEKTDTELLYKGNITGNGDFTKKGVGTLNMQGDNSGFTGLKTVQEGMIILGTSAIGDTSINRWVVNASGTIAIQGVDSQQALTYIDASSTGTFALMADRLTQLNFSSNPKLTLGAIGTINYGQAGTNEKLGAFSDNQWRLGGGGGTLIVNYQLSGQNDLIVGNGVVFSNPNKVHLSNVNNDFIGKIVINAGSVLSFDDTKALGNINNAISIRSSGSLDILGQTLNHGIELQGAGSGNAPWALLNSSEQDGFAKSVKLTGNATIGGLTGDLTIGTLNLNAFTLTLSGGNLSVNGANLINGNLTLTGETSILHAENFKNTGTLTISNGASLVVSDSDNSTLASPGKIVINAGTVTTEGSHPSVLANALTIAGKTIFTSSADALLTLRGKATGAGEVFIQNRVGISGDWLGYTGKLTVDSGAILDLGTRSGNSFSAGSVILNGTITGDASTVFYNAQKLSGSGDINNIGLNYSGNSTVSYSLSGTASLTVQSGTVVLQGVNTSTGGVVLNGGRLELTGGANRLGSGTTVINTGASLATLGSFAINGDSSLANAPALSIRGGSVVLGGTEYLQNIDFQGGSMMASSASGQFLGASESGLTIQAKGNAGTATMSGNLDLSRGDLKIEATRGSNDSDLVISSNIGGSASDHSGNLSKYGNGVVQLSGINTYEGSTSVHEGTLKLVRVASVGKGDITVDRGASLELSGNQWDNKSVLNQKIVNNGNLVLNNSFASLKNLDASSTGDLILNQSTLNLGAQSTAAASNVTLSQGSTLSFTLASTGPNPEPMLTLTGTLTLNDGASLDFNFEDGFTPLDGKYFLVHANSFTGNILNSLTAGSYRGQYSLSIDENGLYLNVSGSSMVNLTWTGTGSRTWETDGVNNWLVAGGSTADKFYSKDFATFGDAGAGNVTINGRVLASDVNINSSLDYNFTADSTNGGTIATAGTIEKNGKGTLTLSSDNLIDARQFLLKDGTLELAASNVMGKTLLVISNGATLLNSNTSSDRTLSTNIRIDGAASFEAKTRNLILNGTIEMVGDSAEMTTLGQGSIIMTGSISGSNLIKSGAGTLDLRSLFTADSLTLRAGTLALSQETILGSSTLRMEGGSLLMSESAFTTSGGVARTQWTIANNLELSGSSSLKVNTSSTNTSYKGCAFNLSGNLLVDAAGATLNSANNLTLSGTGAGGILTKTGNSVLRVNGDMNGLEKLVISQGEFILGNSANVPRFELGKDAFINFIVGRNFTETITGTGTIIMDSPSATTTLFSNANSKNFAGTLELRSGRIEAPSSYFSPSMNIVVKDGGQITMNGEVLNKLTLTGTGWNASGDPAKAASLRLSRATVKGTINIVGSTQIGVYVSDGASRIDGNITGGSLTKTMAGLLSLKADATSSYSSLTIAGGILRIDGGEGNTCVSTALGLGKVTVNSGTKLQFSPGKKDVASTYSFGNDISIAQGSSLEALLGNTRLTGIVTVGATAADQFHSIRIQDTATLDLAKGITGSGNILFNDDVACLGSLRVGGEGGSTGKWIYQRGNLYLDSNNAIRNVSELVLQTADLYINSSNVYINKLTTEKETSIHASGTGRTVSINEGEIKGNLDGDLKLVMNGTSGQVLTLEGKNTHSGGISVNKGTLVAKGGNNLGTGVINISYGATMELKDWAAPYTLASSSVLNNGTLKLTNVTSLSVNRQFMNGALSGNLQLDHSSINIVEGGGMMVGEFKMFNQSDLTIHMENQIKSGAALSANSFSFEAGSTLNVIFTNGAKVGMTYDILSSATTIDWSGLQNIVLSIPGSRYEYRWNKTASSLSLTIDNIYNAKLVWNPADGSTSGKWSKDSSNMNWNVDGNAMSFIDSDIVLFESEHAGTVSISDEVSAAQISVSGGTYTFASDGGKLIGKGTLTVSGAGTILNMNLANSYSGETLVSNGGTLNASAVGALGTGALKIDGGTAVLSNEQNVYQVKVLDGTLKATVANALGSGTLTVSGGTADISAAQRIVDTTVTGGILNATGTNSLGIGALTVSGGTVNISASQVLAISSIQSGGHVILSGLGTMGTGKTTIEEGGRLSFIGSSRFTSLADSSLVMEGGTITLDFAGQPSNSVNFTTKFVSGGSGTIELRNSFFSRFYPPASFNYDIRIGANAQLRVDPGSGMLGTYILDSSGLATAGGESLGAIKAVSGSLCNSVRLASNSGITIWGSETATVNYLDGAGFDFSKYNGGSLVVNMLTGNINTLSIIAGGQGGSGRLILNSIAEGKSIAKVVMENNFGLVLGGIITSFEGTTLSSKGTSGTSYLEFNQEKSMVLSGITAGTASNRIRLVVNQDAGDVRIEDSVLNLSNIAKNGDSTMTLASQANISGTVTIAAGTFKVTGAGSLDGSGNIANNGSLELAKIGDYTLSKQVTGTGNLVQSGTGTLLLNHSNNTFTGELVAQSGQIRANAAGGFGKGTLVATGTGTIDLGSLAVSNAIRIDSATADILHYGKYTGNVTLNAAWTQKESLLSSVVVNVADGASYNINNQNTQHTVNYRSTESVSTLSGYGNFTGTLNVYGNLALNEAFHGTLIARQGGSANLNNTGNADHARIQIEQGASFSIDSDTIYTVKNDSSIVNAGSFTNNGTILLNSGLDTSKAFYQGTGIFSNNGRIDLSGSYSLSELDQMTSHTTFSGNGVIVNVKSSAESDSRVDITGDISIENTNGMGQSTAIVGTVTGNLNIGSGLDVTTGDVDGGSISVNNGSSVTVTGSSVSGNVQASGASVNLNGVVGGGIQDVSGVASAVHDGKTDGIISVTGHTSIRDEGKILAGLISLEGKDRHVRGALMKDSTDGSSSLSSYQGSADIIARGKNGKGGTARMDNIAFTDSSAKLVIDANIESAVIDSIQGMGNSLATSSATRVSGTIVDIGMTISGIGAENALILDGVTIADKMDLTSIAWADSASVVNVINGLTYSVAGRQDIFTNGLDLTGIFKGNGILEFDGTSIFLDLSGINAKDGDHFTVSFFGDSGKTRTASSFSNLNSADSPDVRLNGTEVSTKTSGWNIQADAVTGKYVFTYDETQSVPEPSSVAMGMLAMAAMLLRRKRS